MEDKVEVDKEEFELVDIYCKMSLMLSYTNHDNVCQSTLVE